MPRVGSNYLPTLISVSVWDGFSYAVVVGAQINNQNVQKSHSADEEAVVQIEEKETSVSSENTGIFTNPLSAAMHVCSSVSPMSSSSPNPYKPYEGYRMVNAQLMFKYGGDGQWGQLVRSCLLCMYDFNMSPQQAHGFCYNDAARRVGQTNAILGYSWAIGAAFVIETYQIYQFINGGDLEQAVGPWIQQAIDITLDHILKSVQ